MKTLEEFLESEIEEFESPECQNEFDQLSDARKNNILFKRLLFDYDEELQKALIKFISSGGTVPAWSDLNKFYPELKYIIADQPAPVDIAITVLKEISLD
jgi:flagellar biosynthesis chaperone FliJ